MERIAKVIAVIVKSYNVDITSFFKQKYETNKIYKLHNRLYYYLSVECVIRKKTIMNMEDLVKFTSCSEYTLRKIHAEVKEKAYGSKNKPAFYIELKMLERMVFEK